MGVYSQYLWGIRDEILDREWIRAAMQSALQACSLWGKRDSFHIYSFYPLHQPLNLSYTLVRMWPGKGSCLLRRTVFREGSMTIPSKLSSEGRKIWSVHHSFPCRSLVSPSVIYSNGLDNVCISYLLPQYGCVAKTHNFWWQIIINIHLVTNM